MRQWCDPFFLHTTDRTKESLHVNQAMCYRWGRSFHNSSTLPFLNWFEAMPGRCFRFCFSLVTLGTFGSLRLTEPGCVFPVGPRTVTSGQEVCVPHLLITIHLESSASLRNTTRGGESPKKGHVCVLKVLLSVTLQEIQVVTIYFKVVLEIILIKRHWGKVTRKNHLWSGLSNAVRHRDLAGAL